MRNLRDLLRPARALVVCADLSSAALLHKRCWSFRGSSLASTGFLRLDIVYCRFQADVFGGAVPPVCVRVRVCVCVCVCACVYVSLSVSVFACLSVSNHRLRGTAETRVALKLHASLWWEDFRKSETDHTKLPRELDQREIPNMHGMAARLAPGDNPENALWRRRTSSSS